MKIEEQLQGCKDRIARASSQLAKAAHEYEETRKEAQAELTTATGELSALLALQRTMK